jgi:hypothetical protein
LIGVGEEELGAMIGELSSIEERLFKMITITENQISKPNQQGE